MVYSSETEPEITPIQQFISDKNKLLPAQLQDIFRFCSSGHGVTPQVFLIANSRTLNGTQFIAKEIYREWRFHKFCPLRTEASQFECQSFLYTWPVKSPLTLTKFVVVVVDDAVVVVVVDVVVVVVVVRALFSLFLHFFSTGIKSELIKAGLG